MPTARRELSAIPKGMVSEIIGPVLSCRTDWASAKVLLGDSNFLKRLYEYDKDNIADAMIKKLKKYTDNPKFVPDVVEKVSKVRACV